MRDIRLQKLASVIVNYSLEIKKGEYVLLQGSSITQPLLKELYREVLRKGAHPEVLVSFEEMKEILYKEGTEEQIKFISPLDRLLVEKYDASVFLWGEENVKALSNIDVKRIAMRRKVMRELMIIESEREEKGQFRWCGTQFPTNGDAQEASMSLDEYEDFVYKAGYLDKEDPVAEWKKISVKQQKIVDYLNSKKSIYVKSKDTDLRFSTEGRRWINCDGKVNFPDGEVFTAPVENSVEGYIRFSYPGIYNGREIEDIRLEFSKGKVVKASATKGQELLSALLDTDEGARILGEFAIGTNYEIDVFTKNILFDEKIGGTIHAALGRTIAGTNGKNQSGIHWDMICDMEHGQIFADDELFYENGKFIEHVINNK